MQPVIGVRARAAAAGEAQRLRLRAPRRRCAIAAGPSPRRRSQAPPDGITGIDNAIRDEAVLEGRTSHATLPSARAARKVQRRDELMGRTPLVDGDAYVAMRKLLVKLEHMYA